MSKRLEKSAGTTIPEGSFIEAFSSITGPRIDRSKEHLLPDIIVIAVCAIICGADGWVDTTAYGTSKYAWLIQAAGSCDRKKE